MSMDPKTDIVRRWLDEGVTELPDRVLDAVLDQLPATPQRRIGGIRRWFPMPLRFAVGAAAAAMTVVLVAGLLGSPSENRFGGAPQASILPTPYPVLRGGSELPPGRYALPESLGVPITLQVPAGWFSCSLGAQELGVCSGLPDGPGVGFLVVSDVLEDPCDHSSRSDPPLGPGVDDLVEAIAGLDGFTSTEPEATRVDGYLAQRLIVRAPTQNPCFASGDGLGTWATTSRVNGVGLGETNDLRVVELNGVRILIAAAYPSTATEAIRDEVREVLESIRIGP